MITGQLATLYVDLVSRDKVAPAMAEMAGRVKNLRAEFAKTGTAGWGQQMTAFMGLQRQQRIEQERLNAVAGKTELADMGTARARRELVEYLSVQKEVENIQSKMRVAGGKVELGYAVSQDGKKASTEAISLQRELETIQAKMRVAGGKVELGYELSAKGKNDAIEFLRLQKELEFQEIKRGQSKTGTQIAYAESAGGAKMIRDHIAAQKESVEQQKKLSRAMDVAALGKFGVAMRDVRDGFEKMSEKISAVGSVFPWAMAGMTGMVAAASPDAFQTFTMSLQYLAAVVGQALLPAFVDIIIWIQDAARWFRNLDDETKRLIGSAALWSIGFLAAAFALSRVIAVVRTLYGAMAALASIRLPGWLMGGLSVVGAVASIAGAYSAIRAFSHPEGSAEREAALSPWYMSHTSTRSIGDTARREGADRHSLETSRLYRPEAGFWERVLVGPSVRTGGGDGAPMGGGMGGISGMAPPRDFGSVIESIPGLSDGLRALGARPATRDEARETHGRGRTDSRLLLGMNFESQFIGIEQYWKSIQQQAASDSPLEIEMRGIAIDSREYLRAIAEGRRPGAPVGAPRPGMTP